MPMILGGEHGIPVGKDRGQLVLQPESQFQKIPVEPPTVHPLGQPEKNSLLWRRGSIVDGGQSGVQRPVVRLQTPSQYERLWWYLNNIPPG